MNFEFTIPKGAAAAAGRCRDQAGLLGALATRMDLLNEAAVDDIQMKRFSRMGPESLGVRTSRLRTSIRPSKAVVSGNAVLSTIGSNVKYLGIWEHGGTIRAHDIVGTDKPLRFAIGGKILFRWKVHQPAREVAAKAPLRRGIEDYREGYREGLASAASDFYAGKAA
jgi:hypothetical protein